MRNANGLPFAASPERQQGIGVVFRRLQPVSELVEQYPFTRIRQRRRQLTLKFGKALTVAPELALKLGSCMNFRCRWEWLHNLGS